MSKIAITGAATGTATFTIESPATSTNRTLTIPDATTTLVGTDATQTLTNKSIVATQLTGDVAAARITDALNATGSAPIFAARAWVNFNGTGVVAIRASGNVSSITDVGTGLYTVNFTSAMSDVNYCVQMSSGNSASSTDSFSQVQSSGLLSALSTSAVSVAVRNASAFVDHDLCYVAIFR